MIWILLLIAFCLWIFREMHWKRRNLPPGPTPLPLIGNLHQILWNFPGQELLNSCAKQYGSLHTYWLGTVPIVSVNDYETMQEMFVQDGENYADRAALSKFTEEYRGGILGVIETSGHVWREQRRFALHTLRDFGLGKDAMQERILIEVVGLLDSLETDYKTNGTVWPIKHLEQSVASVINLVIFGYRFDETTVHELHENRRLQDEIIQISKNPLAILGSLIPYSRKFWPFSNYMKQIFIIRDQQFGFFEKNIEIHRARIDYSNEEVDDFCDAYLKEAYRRKDDPDSTFHDKQFVNVCLDIWSAGMETTASTMAWATALLLHHPEVQQKLHAEFDRVIGSDRLITMQDKSALPYTNAFINELQRWANILPQNLLRKSGKDITIKGHFIPAGTSICPQISIPMCDPEIFPDHHLFNPDRFIDESGKVRTIKQLMPFSLGKRQCLGEGLARMELFLFFANLTHRFRFIPADAGKLPSLKKSLANLGKTEPFEAKLERRFVH